MNRDTCSFCGAKIKNTENSFHIWETEYECGYHITGAIDTETHGDGISINSKCGNEKVEDIKTCKFTGRKYTISKVKCDCMCHEPDASIMHIMPCCDKDGYTEKFNYIDN